jgi:PEP-CTERM motif
MSKIFKPTSIAIMSLVGLLSLSRATHAASFTFHLDGILAQGSLKFTSSSLTEVGLETIGLNQIPDAKYSFNVSSFYSIQSSSTSFTFLNGQLNGVIVSYSSPKYPINSQGNPIGWLTYYLYLTGNNWKLTKWSSATGNTTTQTGAISFQTLEPIGSNPVPEPSTVLGVALGVAGIMGLRPRFR